MTNRETTERKTEGAPGILIVGATGGIGRRLAERLAGRGARLVLAARTTDELEAMAGDLGGAVVGTCAADAATSEGAERIVATAAECLDRLDGVAHLVGSILLKPAHLTDDDDWANTLETNLGSAFRILRSATKAMRRSGGSIAFVSTAAARIGLANHEAIAAAKGGLEALTRSAAASYAGRGIRVNCVAPGLVDTPLAARITGNPRALETSQAMHPLGRIGRPSDVASALAWLLDPEQSWVTGQILGVDGGLADLKLR